ncbi:hypothetical protein [Streptomyces populi]|uniref:hypothetical protein n=1 Tax=Streptomyces populi TaxID=2058924 RepID=UPI0013A6B26B|nr:hypothetical protein [Streptomyces populi]
MTQPTLAGLALTVTAGVYVVLGIAWSLRAYGDRRSAARLGSLDIDPYHAMAAAGRPENVDEAAAAVLIASGAALVDDEGIITVTSDRGEGHRRPEHPLPAALLDALDRKAGSASLRGIVHDAELCRARAAYLRARDAETLGRSGRRKDHVKGIAILTMAFLTLFYAVQIIFLREELAPHGVVESLFAALFLLVLWLMICVPMVWLVIRFWPDRRDPFREHCAKLPLHPALAALDDHRRGRLRESVLHKEEWEKERERRVDVDTPDAF